MQMALPLLALIIGILLSPCLDSRSVWICLPVAILISFVKRRCALLAVALAGAGLAARQPAVLPDPGDTAVRLVGRLTKAPEWRGLGGYLDVELQTVDGQRYPGRARLTEFLDDPDLRRLFDAFELGSGDRLEIVVKLHRPVVYRNPGVFDYRRHLERQGVYWTGTIRNPRLITVLDRGWHGKDRIKNWIQTRLEAPFAADRNGQTIRGLVTGMVLGRTYGLTAEVERQFQAGGLFHPVVFFGFYLGLVAGIGLLLGPPILLELKTPLLFVLACMLAFTANLGRHAPVFPVTLIV